ncbi:MAG TPA: M48 family metallopeptidase [Acidobacteriota bacterium]|jgi:hypothetical protein
MNAMNNYLRNRILACLMAFLIVATPIAGLAQTRIKPPSNKYSVSQDVELGQQAAAEADKQLPILGIPEVNSYISNLGRKLAASIPPEYQHPEFRYTFKVVDAKDINAFALPGGPMYVNRGMIEAAETEGEVAGVMAHEMSHVALRHGTAQATKAQKYQVGAVAGAILGAIIGGNVGSVVAQGSQFGLGAAFLRFSREYEKQADLLGTQTMARAGYDPMDMAHMFEIIEKQGGRGGPQWLSDHPNPGNRIAYIRDEAQSLRVQNPVRDTREFARVQSLLGGLAPARSTEEIMRGGGRGRREGGTYPSGTQVGGRVEAPSGRYRTYNEGNLFRVSVPENWRELSGNNAVTFAPDGAYGQVRGHDVFTHGVQIGLTRNEMHNLRDATEEFVAALSQGNPNMRQQSGYQRATVAGYQGLSAVFSNISEATGRTEVVTIYTTLMRDGNLFYIITVAPEQDYRNYQNAFQNVVRSVQIVG